MTYGEWEMKRIQIPILANIGDRSVVIHYIRKNVLINCEALSEFSSSGMSKIISMLFDGADVRFDFK